MSLNELFNTFANNILPILLISLVGYFLGKKLDVDARSLGRITFYFFSPILVFNLLITNHLPTGEVARIGGMATSVMLVSGLLVLAGGWLFKLERRDMIAVMLTAMFANNGNYGLPLVAFAFGQEALAHSSIYFVFASLLTNTLGVLLASLGHLDFKQAFLGMFRVPTLYAVLCAILINQFSFSLPAPATRTVSLVAGAAVPAMIMLLGLELSRASWKANWRAMGLSVFIRLLIGPVLGLIFASFFGVTGNGRQAGVMEASMSSAVANTNIAAEYKLDASLVTTIILVTTLLSPLTLTPLILYLGK